MARTNTIPPFVECLGTLLDWLNDRRTCLTVMIGQSVFQKFPKLMALPSQVEHIFASVSPLNFQESSQSVTGLMPGDRPPTLPNRSLLPTLWFLRKVKVVIGQETCDSCGSWYEDDCESLGPAEVSAFGRNGLGQVLHRSACIIRLVKTTSKFTKYLPCFDTRSYCLRNLS